MGDEKWISKHITLVAVLHIVYHALAFAVGLIILGVLSTLGLMTGDPCAAAFLTTIGSVVAAFFIVLAIPGVIAGVGLLQRKSWARILTLIVGAIGLLDVPIGTALGIYTFWVLMRDEAIDYLS